MAEEYIINTILSIITMLLFIFINNPLIKTILALFYITVSLINGSKVKILPVLLMFLTIITINIMTPGGLVIFELGSFSITKGALFRGLGRSSLLIGILYLSRNISLTTIRIPGSFGFLIRDTFHYFSQLSSGERIRAKYLIEDLDKKLLNLKSFSPEASQTSDTEKRKHVILPLCAVMTIIMFTIDNILI